MFCRYLKIYWNYNARLNPLALNNVYYRGTLAHL